ncbi:MAG: TonB family protein, partial [Candidatus Aminicenantales bacterium]
MHSTFFEGLGYGCPRGAEMRRKSYFAFIAAGLLFFGPGLLCDAQTVVEIVTDVGCPRQIVKKSIPEYPDNLIDSGAEGRVIVLFEINEGGKVTFATLCRRIHPFLDKLAVESVKRWEFKPCVFDGDVMRTLASVDFFFYPSTSSGARKPEEPENEELKTLLDRCGEYCDKLTAYATFFVCHEKVMEKVNEIHLNEDDISHGKDVLRHIYPVLGGGRRNRYLYDYQLIRKDGETQERRTWLDGCGKEIAGHEISAGETRPWSIKAILVPGMLFSREQRARFSYKMAEGEKVKGRPAYLIEVRPRAGL